MLMRRRIVARNSLIGRGVVVGTPLKAPLRAPAFLLLSRALVPCLQRSKRFSPYSYSFALLQ
jgi:hypothetical protein